jgi:hypothetical protein
LIAGHAVARQFDLIAGTRCSKKQDGNPESFAPDSRALATVDAGCASSWGWREASDQGDLSLGLNSCHSGNLLFSR